MEVPSSIRINLLGQRFERLKVQEFLYMDKFHRAMWKCICDCGKETIVATRSLISNHTNSCGCYKKDRVRQATLKDLTGKRFGKLLILGYSHSDNEKTIWRAICDCGNEKLIRSDSLTKSRKSTQSCGCLQRESASNKRGILNNLWRGGGNGSKYPTEWTHHLREKIRNRDNRKCQYQDCSHTDVVGRKLHVHHIDGDKGNCSEYNLISLCSKHHISIEKTNPENWQDYFYKITGDYEYTR